MKLTLQTQLLPTADQVVALEATMRACNAAADWLAGEAFARKTANKLALQKLFYQDLRERFGLSAQMAVRCIAQVCQAYKRDKTKRPHFREFAAIPYDQRLMSFKVLNRVSLLTLSGRILVPFVMGRYQSERFTAAKGQCDLVRRKDGKWFLLVTVDLPDGTKTPTTDFIGVDLGLANIATDSDGDRYSGEIVEAYRVRQHNLRRQLQKSASGIEYKARRAGVECVLVDPRNTSRECQACGHIDKANRPSQAEFRCVVCGYTDHADVNAARNIRSRARALVNAPKVSEPQQNHLLVA